MASENLIIELLEIIQKNNQEKILYNDFENDLNKAFNLPKDEFDRALKIMIFQAEVNPNSIGEYKSGSFMISQGFAAMVTSTIKYENHFIPGKQEYIAREINNKLAEEFVASAIITPPLIGQMLENFEKLTNSEIACLSGQYHLMDSEQQNMFKIGFKNWLDKIAQIAQSKETIDVVNKIKEVEERKNNIIKKGNKEEIRNEILASKVFTRYYKKTYGIELDEEIEVTDELVSIWEEFRFTKNIEFVNGQVLYDFYSSIKRYIEEKNWTEIERLCSDHSEEIEELKKFLEKKKEEVEKNDGVELDNTLSKGEKNEYIGENISTYIIELFDNKSVLSLEESAFFSEETKDFITETLMTIKEEVVKEELIGEVRKEALEYEKKSEMEFLQNEDFGFGMSFLSNNEVVKEERAVAEVVKDVSFDKKTNIEIEPLMEEFMRIRAEDLLIGEVPVEKVQLTQESVAQKKDEPSIITTIGDSEVIELQFDQDIVDFINEKDKQLEDDEDLKKKTEEKQEKKSGIFNPSDFGQVMDVFSAIRTSQYVSMFEEVKTPIMQPETKNISENKDNQGREDDDELG